MKTAITAQQLVYFRQHGHIRFENFPIDFQAILKTAEKIPEKRDLWRRDPGLKKLILRTLGPLALELTGKKALRIACDQWVDTPLGSGPLQGHFSFQGLAAIFALSAPASLDIFEPSSLSSLLPPNSYLVAFALQNARFIENLLDPHRHLLRKLGYNIGDALTNEHHPLIYTTRGQVF